MTHMIGEVLGSIDIIIGAFIVAFIALLIWIWRIVNPVPPPAKVVSLVADKSSLILGETINFNGVVLQQTTPPTPLVGASVLVDVSNTTTDPTAVTDSSGSYAVQFTPPATGTYTAKAILATGETSDVITFTRSQFEGISNHVFIGV